MPLYTESPPKCQMVLAQAAELEAWTLKQKCKASGRNGGEEGVYTFYFVVVVSGFITVDFLTLWFYI